MPLEEIIRRTTVNPARLIHRPELGNLSVGSTADIAVLEIVKGKFAYLGSGGGKILHDHPDGLSVPLWQDIPKDSRYWADTTRQEF